MEHIPVFVVTGFLEGGKSTFIKEIFNDDEFYKDEKILLILCEEGIEEYQDEFVKNHNVTIVNCDNKQQLTQGFLLNCHEEYKPTKVVVEYNGMWEFNIIEKLKLPKGWEVAQIITPIDASTYENYMNNMKSLLIEQFKNSDLIIFNRCNKKTEKLKFRNSIKALNSSASLIFELENGEIDESPLELPFDINADIIEFEDYDFGVWYLDAAEDPEKYEGKKIKVKGIAMTNPNYPKQIFAFGRNAMTCCEDDIAFLGLLCQSVKPIEFEGKQWIELEGELHAKFIQQEQREIPFIQVENYKVIDKLEEELIYF